LEQEILNDETEELTYLLYHQVEAHAFLQSQKIHHRDITTSSIFLVPTGEFKIAMRRSGIQIERTYHERMSKGDPIYLCPTVY
jgi:hypothetical protein